MDIEKRAEKLARLLIVTPLDDGPKIIAAALREAVAEVTPPKGHVLTDDGKVRKVLGTLPMTADGCVAIPCVSKVYHPNHPHRSLDVGTSWDGVVGKTSTPGKDHDGLDWWEYAIGDCHSTLAAANEAAEAARKEGA